MSLYFNLLNFPKKILSNSQKGQDSIIKYIFDHIKPTNKYYVEFGAVDGFLFCNTHYLRTKENWSGLLLDCDYENRRINLHRRIITKENICQIFDEFNVPTDLDFLCIDIDGNDYWVLQEIIKKYSPRVIQVETNVRFKPHESYVLKYDPTYMWNGRDWYGASPLAYKNLLTNYTAVYLHLDDLFFIRKDALREEDNNISWNLVYPHECPDLYSDHIGKDSSLGIQKTMDVNKWMQI